MASSCAETAMRDSRTCSPGWANLVSWDQRFFDPIMLPGRKPLVTLRDAAQYIIRLPKAERELPEWETAIEWLMLPVPRGKIIGRRVDAQLTDETDLRTISKSCCPA